MSSKIRISSYRTYVVFSILCAVLSILGDQFSIGAIDYVIFLLFFVLSFLTSWAKGELFIPKKYLSIFVCYLIVIIVNAVISPYTMGFKYVTIGTIITLLPFFVFIISYNYNFSINEIDRLIDIWIRFILILCIVACIETFVIKSNVYYQDAIIKISIVKIGFFASLCNQGVVLSLYKYSIGHCTKYRNLALLFTLFSILTVQLKVVIGLLLIWTLYIYFFVLKKKGAIVSILISIVFIGAVTVVNIPPLHEKLIKYTVLYGTGDSFESVARPALYYQSVNIAKDFFPLGSGQGTFGSVPVNMIYNQIYYDYGLSNIHGLGESGDNFKMDTHWSSIIGENGFLGTVLYLLLFYFPLSYIKRIKGRASHKHIKFLTITIFTVITVESITLCIPGRMAFMFIYAGILGIICRKISMNHL